MAFELLKPHRGKAKLKGIVISINKHNVILSKELIEDWPENCNYVQVYLDKQNKKIAIKPVKTNDGSAVTVSRNKKTQSRFFQSKILINNGVKPGKVGLLFDKKNGMYVGQFPYGSKIKGNL
ncbi:hypothetical protein ACFL5V_03880 [Fibrobacterota bacterium]